MSINFQELAAIKDHLGAYPHANLLLVTKNRNQETIKRLIELGYQHLGENKVQETLSKWSEQKKINKNLKLHMIGKLQSNKAKDAVKIFDYIHSVDNQKLA